MSEVVIAILLVVGFIALVAVVVGIAVLLPRLQEGRRTKRWAAGPKTRDGIMYYPSTGAPGFMSFGSGDAGGGSDGGSSGGHSGHHGGHSSCGGGGSSCGGGGGCGGGGCGGGSS